MTLEGSKNWESGTSTIEPAINGAGVHVWPFDAFCPVDVRFLSLDKGQGIRMNRHRYLELLCVCDGSTTFGVKDRLFPLGQGDLIVIGSDVPHQMIAGPEVKVVALYFEPELIRVGDTTGEHIEYLTPFLCQGPGFPHVVGRSTRITEEIADLMRRIHSELPAGSPQSKVCAKTYLKMGLALLMKHYADSRAIHDDLHRRRKIHARLRPAFDFIETGFAEPLRIEDAARRCGMSDSHFMWYFKQTTGQSFHSYVTALRIAKAQMLLSTTDLPISHISQDLGFCDQSHFGVVFRRIVGQTPLAFRQRFEPATDPNGALLTTGVTAGQ